MRLCCTISHGSSGGGDRSASETDAVSSKCKCGISHVQESQRPCVDRGSELLKLTKAANRDVTEPSTDTHSPTDTEPAHTPSPGRRWKIFTMAVVVALGVIAVTVTTVVRHVGASVKAGVGVAVTVTASSCAPGWSGTTSGRHVFHVKNSSSELFDVELLGSDRASIYGDIETLAPGTTVPLNVILGPGTYYWRCTTSTGSVSKSGPGAVRGRRVAGTAAYLPVTYAELASAASAYRLEITGGLTTLDADTDALTAAVASGNRAQAEQRWLVAHLDYARLGAAYGTFGTFDTEINGRPNGLPLGVNDPKFHGFLRLEYGLWHDQPTLELVAVADRLDADVHGLVRAFPTQATPPTDVPLRTHEILENALQFELTGETDQGSHTNIATAAANVTGTEMTLGAIAPLLEQRDPSLVTTVRSGLTAVEAELSSYRQPDGSWLPLQSLSQSQRERLDGSMSQLLEELAPIPDILALSPNAADKT